MRVFDVGDEATILARLGRFAREMDDLGQPYGNSGGEDFMPPRIVEPGDDERPHRAEEAHAIAVLSGRGWVLGDGGRVKIKSGEGAWWSASEEWDIGAVDGPMLYIEVEGPSLRAQHLSR